MGLRIRRVSENGGVELLTRPGRPSATASGSEEPGEELQLDAGQQDRINKILDEHRAQLYEVHREALVKFEEERQDLQHAVRGVLRSDQQEKFQRFLERRP